jgi:hypothetical protein
MGTGCGYVGVVLGVGIALLAVGTVLINVGPRQVAWVGEAVLAGGFFFIAVMLWVQIRRLER